MKSNGNQLITDEKRIGMKEKLEKVFSEMLTILEFDNEDPQLEGTPKRMARMYVDELFSGCYAEEPKITVFPNEKAVSQSERYPVFLGNISLKSMCSHHFLPFVGDVAISYIPGEVVVGISKLSRIVNWFMRRPQIQEQFTEQLAEYLIKKLKTDHVIVHASARHMCMTIRGVRESNSIMETTATRGSYFKQLAARREFFEQIERVAK